MPESNPQMTKVKDVKYWKERGGQIEWRLSAQRGIVREMERDLAECDENLKRLSNVKA